MNLENLRLSEDKRTNIIDSSNKNLPRIDKFLVTESRVALTGEEMGN